MIQTEELTRVYRMGGEEVRALDGVSVRIEAAEAVAVLGPSGSGKSTFMHLVGGLDTPTHGRVVVDGEDVARMGPAQKAHYRNKKVGFVFQFFYLQPHLSALENVELPLKIAGVKKGERVPLALARLDEVGLGARRKHLPSELSGGERQRVCIARALANDPRMVLADEPTGNLDTTTGRGILDLFQRLREERGITLVVVTHDPAVAARCGRTIRLRDGRLSEEA